MARQTVSEQDLNRMAVRGAKVRRKSSAVPTKEEVAATAPPPTPPTPPQAPPDNSMPMASMAASSNAINQQLASIVEQNSQTIMGLQDDLRRQMMHQPKKTPWDFFVYRDRSKLIERVRAVPVES